MTLNLSFSISVWKTLFLSQLIRDSKTTSGVNVCMNDSLSHWTFVFALCWPGDLYRWHPSLTLWPQEVGTSLLWLWIDTSQYLHLVDGWSLVSLASRELVLLWFIPEKTSAGTVYVEQGTLHNFSINFRPSDIGIIHFSSSETVGISHLTLGKLLTETCHFLIFGTWKKTGDTITPYLMSLFFFPSYNNNVWLRFIWYNLFHFIMEEIISRFFFLSATGRLGNISNVWVY